MFKSFLTTLAIFAVSNGVEIEWEKQPSYHAPSAPYGPYSPSGPSAPYSPYGPAGPGAPSGYGGARGYGQADSYGYDIDGVSGAYRSAGEAQSSYDSPYIAKSGGVKYSSSVGLPDSPTMPAGPGRTRGVRAPSRISSSPGIPLLPTGAARPGLPSRPAGPFEPDLSCRRQQPCRRSGRNSDSCSLPHHRAMGLR